MADPYRIFPDGYQSRASAGEGMSVPPAVYPPYPAPHPPSGATLPAVAIPRTRTQPVIPQKPTQRSTRRILFWMVGVALAIRVAVLLCTYQGRLIPIMNYWFMGQEEGHVAQSIVQGHGFGNPLYTQTGPTAWFAPVYPYILAGFFKVFGTFTPASCIAILCFDALVSSLTCIPIFLFSRRSFGEGAALAAGWTWAAYPYAVWWPVYRIWDTWLVTLLLATLFYLILKLQHTSKIKHWIGFGLLAGFAALVDPIVMGVLPILALWALWRLYKRGTANATGADLLATTSRFTMRQPIGDNASNGRALRQNGVEPPHKKAKTVCKVNAGRLFACGACCVLAVIFAISPWMIRNAVVFHKFIPIRDNLPLEFRVGNNGDSSEPLIIDAGPWVPWVDNTEWNEYTHMGELAYFHLKGQQAKAYIEAHPLWYAGMMARRFVYVWTGFWSFSKRYMSDPYANHEIDFVTTPLLALLSILMLMGLRRTYRKKGANVAAPYAVVVIFFPLVYYLTHVGGWYRCPMEPIIIPLAAYEVHARAVAWLRERRQKMEIARASEMLEESGEEVPAAPFS